MANQLLFPDEKDDRWGYIDEHRNVIVPHIYNYAETFDEGVARVRMGRKWGLIDQTGKVLLLCNKYNVMWPIADCKFVVATYDENRNLKYGAIDKSGKELIACQYDYMRSFYNNMACFNLGGTFNKYLTRERVVGGKWGVIDSQNTVIIKPEYDYIYSYMNGYAKVKYNDKYGFIDFNKRLIRNLKYDRMGYFSEGLCVVGLLGKVKEIYDELTLTTTKIQYGYINIDNKEVIPCIYDTAHKFENGLAYVELNGKYNYIDKNGSITKEWCTPKREYENYVEDDWRDRNKELESMYRDAFDGNPDAVWNID